MMDRSYLVSINSSLREGIETLNSNKFKVAIVVDDQDVLFGTLTDGDIRRALLRGLSLSSCIVDVCQKQPILLKSTDSFDEAEDILEQKKLSFLPVVDQQNRVIDIFFHSDLKKKGRDIPVVLMAGGLGSRLGELTKDCPKPMLKIDDKPIMEHILKRFVQAGHRTFYITVNYLSQIIKDYFGDGQNWGVQIEYIDEAQRLGTAGSLFYLKEKIKSHFILMNADIISGIDFNDLTDYHIRSGSFATLCTRKYTTQIPYGVIVSQEGYVKDLQEKPIFHYDISAGIYIVRSEILNYLTTLQQIDMPDLLRIALADHKKLSIFPVHEEWYDVGHVDEYLQVKKTFKALSKNE